MSPRDALVWIARRSDASSAGAARLADGWPGQRRLGAARPARGARAGAPAFDTAGVDGQFQRDRARIIHSASFRALQSKTQVLGLGESDFYRTRLTHSLEVAQIGSGICESLREREPNPALRALIPSFSLIEAICLAHDIGHSPFGHGGEVAMNAMMRDAGGFEANAQTLRILARLGEYSAECGVDLTRRAMLGTVKYPALWSEACRFDPDLPTPAERPLNIDRWAPPKCLYDADAEVLDWLLDPFPASDRDRLRTLHTPASGHRRSVHRTFDTSIMEIADDVAYGVHDLEDALALGLVERDAWHELVTSRLVGELAGAGLAEDAEVRDRRLFSPLARDRKHAISKLVGYFIARTGLSSDERFASPLLALQAGLDPAAREVLSLIKGFVMDHVIRRPELQQLQYKGQRVIVTLFAIFAENPERLLPRPVLAVYEREGPRAIADHLSAMTDISAGKLYHKLLSPAAGSIYDRP